LARHASKLIKKYQLVNNQHLIVFLTTRVQVSTFYKNCTSLVNDAQTFVAVTEI